MKKADIIARLTSLCELTKAPEIKEGIEALIADLGPVTEIAEGKIHRYITVNERVLDPAKKYPAQMIECHKILEDAGLVGKTVERQAIMDLIGENKERLKTRQSPDRIYSFYQKPMEDEGWLERTAERK